MKSFLLCALVVALISCSSTPTSTNKLIAASHLKMKLPLPTVGKTSSGQVIFLGGFSGLTFKETKDGELIFSAITDRGPNVHGQGNEHIFLLPEYSPQIVNLKTTLKDSAFEMVDVLKLKTKNGAPLSGLPNVRTEENPVDVFGFMYSLDPIGLNPEAFTTDDEGGFWVGEAYAPSLVHFASNGVLLRRLTPFNELPKMYGERKPNRGFAGIAKVQNKIFGFLQSALPTDMTFARIVEVDLDSMKTSGEYFYDFDKGMNQIGDFVSLGNNKFLVIESNGQKEKRIYKITLNGTDNHVKKELLIDLEQTPFKNLEKVEGLALVNPRKIALVNNNDFQVSTKTDFKTGITPLNSDGNEMLILEFTEDISK